VVRALRKPICSNRSTRERALKKVCTEGGFATAPVNEHSVAA